MRGNIYDRLSERREREERLERERLEAETIKGQPIPLRRYFTNEISFERPESLKDKTFHVFSMTDSGPSPLSVVLGRAHIKPDYIIDELLQRLTADMDKSLSHLQWIEHPAPLLVAGEQGRLMEFKWRQQGKPVHQVQVVFIFRDESGLPLLMQLTATSNNPKGMPLEDRGTFDAIVASIQFRGARDNGDSVSFDE